MGRSIPPKEQVELLEEFGAEASRIIVKMTPKIKKYYASEINLIDLLMALPVKFEFSEYDAEDLQAMPDGSIPSEEALALGGYIKRDTESGNPDRMVVFLIFNKEKNRTWGEYFNWAVNNDLVIAHAAFTYLHEALHILNRHYDYYLNVHYESIIKHANPEISKDQMHNILNHGFDYWINAYLIEKALSGSEISKFARQSEHFANLYDPNLSPQLLTQQEIIEKLAKEAEITETEIPGLGKAITIGINGSSSTTIYIDEQSLVANETRDPNSKPSEAEQEICEVLASARNQLLDKTRGSGSTGTLEELGVSYEVPTDWFKKLKSSLFNVVQKYTNNSDQTWAKLKNKFRHVAPMPGRIYYDNKLASIISIDQSGSMSNDDLKRINYVVEELAKKSMFVEILLHDTSVAKQQRFKQNQLKSISEFITTRVACGGTSHKEVFQKIDEIKKENKDLKFIYLSFSDNWSDIEEVYDPEIFKNVNSYWVTTDDNRIVNVPGMQVSLEHGLIKE